MILEERRKALANHTRAADDTDIVLFHFLHTFLSARPQRLLQSPASAPSVPGKPTQMIHNAQDLFLSEKKPVEIRSYIQYNRMRTGFYESLPAEKL